MNSKKAQSLAHVSHQVAPLVQCGWLLLVGGCCKVKVPAVVSPKPSLASATLDKENQRPRKVQPPNKMSYFFLRNHTILVKTISRKELCVCFR